MKEGGQTNNRIITVTVQRRWRLDQRPKEKDIKDKHEATLKWKFEWKTCPSQ